MALKKHQKKTSFAQNGSLALPSARVSSALLIMIGLFIFIFSMTGQSRLSGLRMAVSDIAAPVIQTMSWPFQQVGDFIGNISGLTVLKEENIRLTEENRKLRQWFETAQFLESENRSLRTLLNVVEDPSHSYVSARVIKDTSRSYAQSLLLTAGTDDGVKKGQAVLSAHGLAGRILETGSNTARVLLLTDLNSRVPVTIEGTNLQAILTGDNSKEAFLGHLPKDTSVRKGAKIITSGQGGLFPPGLAVGQALRVDKNGRIRIALNTKFDKLQHVQIVRYSLQNTLEIE